MSTPGAAGDSCGIHSSGAGFDKVDKADKWVRFRYASPAKPPGPRYNVMQLVAFRPTLNAAALATPQVPPDY